MKCKNCKGTGQEKVYDPLTNAYLLIKCAYCNGSGKKPMTNEEWFCQLPTKEKAEFISEVRHGMSERVMEIEKIFNDEDLDYEEAVEKWLKEVHHEVS